MRGASIEMHFSGCILSALSQLAGLMWGLAMHADAQAAGSAGDQAGCQDRQQQSMFIIPTAPAVDVDVQTSPRSFSRCCADTEEAGGAGDQAGLQGRGRS